MSKPKIVWAPTRNFYRGNFPTEPEIHILHGTMGELKSALPWLQGKNGNRNSSAHFVISREGTVYNLAGVEKRTWHAGVIKQPNEKGRELLAKFGKNPNKYSIGYEVVIKWGEDYSKEQVQAWCDLYEYLKEKYNWKKPLNDYTLVTHKDFHVGKPNLDKSREAIIKELKKRGLWETKNKEVSYLDRIELLESKVTTNTKLIKTVLDLLVRLITMFAKNQGIK